MSNRTDFICGEQELSRTMSLAIDKVETPLYLILGLLSRVISLLSIYRESKTEEAYLFQIFVLVAELVEILCQFLSQMTQMLTSPFRLDAPWFMRSYACMWFHTHLMDILNVGAKTNTNLLTLVMTSDRVYGMLRPAKYGYLRERMRKVRPWIPLGTALFSLFVSSYTGLIFDLGQEDTNGIYIRVATHAEFGKLCGAASALLDLILIISNIVATVLLCYGFSRAMEIRAKVMSGQENPSTQWRTLFKMTFCQAFCNTFSSMVSIGYRVTVATIGLTAGALYYKVDCVLSPIATALMELTDIAQFCLIMTISKKFRRMVINTVKRARCGKGGDSIDSVTTVQVAEMQRNQ